MQRSGDAIMPACIASPTQNGHVCQSTLSYIDALDRRFDSKRVSEGLPLPDEQAARLLDNLHARQRPWLAPLCPYVRPQLELRQK